MAPVTALEERLDNQRFEVVVRHESFSQADMCVPQSALLRISRADFSNQFSQLIVQFHRYLLPMPFENVL